MDSLAESNAFLVIAAIAIIIIAVSVVTVAIYTIRILRDVKSVTKRVKGGAEEVSKDAVPLLKNIMKILGTTFMVGIIQKFRPKKKK